MRALIVLLALAAVSPAFAVDYGTPMACSAVAQGHDPEELAGGLEGENPSYFFNGSLLIGPEYVCDIATAGPSECYAGGDEPFLTDVQVSIVSEGAAVVVDEMKPVVLAPCTEQ